MGKKKGQRERKRFIRNVSSRGQEKINGQGSRGRKGKDRQQKAKSGKRETKKEMR